MVANDLILDDAYMWTEDKKLSPNTEMSPEFRARKHLLFLVGTRPEAIKLAPLIKRAEADPAHWIVTVCFSGQHDELAQQVFELFRIEPQFRLKVMRAAQPLSELSSRLLEAFSPVLADVHPDAVIVQGDTTTAFVGALTAFYERIPVAHVEAGLRTNNPYAPFPEEINRRLIAQIATWHFAPTVRAMKNLLAENIPSEKIFVVGNTVIDAVREILRRAPETNTAEVLAPPDRPFVLVTHHRRESFGLPVERVFWAIEQLAQRHPEIDFLFPVHPNPNVRERAVEILGKKPNILLQPPLPYHLFVHLMAHALFLITDSGGIQEEATALGKHVLVTREITERPETVEAGLAILVGTDQQKLMIAAEQLLSSKSRLQAPISSEVTPFGDGRASERILEKLVAQLGAVEITSKADPAKSSYL